MPVARPEPAETRVIAHLDLDCFYVQVEQRKRPELRGKPSAVVQFNPWKGGGLIAVSYEARRAGVTRFVLQVLHNLTPLVFLHNVELQMQGSVIFVLNQFCVIIVVLFW
jgi:hypothetical protein